MREVENINQLIRDLYFKKEVYQEFKKNPEQVGLKYNVSSETIEAIKENDWLKLVNKGMNPKFLENPVYRVRDKIRLWFGRIVLSVLVFVFGFLGNVSVVWGARFNSRLNRARNRLLSRRKRLLARVGKEKEIFLASRFARVIDRFVRVSKRLSGRKENVFARARKKPVLFTGRKRAFYKLETVLGKELLEKKKALIRLLDPIE